MTYPIHAYSKPLFLCAALAVAAAEPVTAGARPERPLIRLSCPDPQPGGAGRDAVDALCRATVQALAEAAPGFVIRRVSIGAEDPGRPDDLGVALRLEPGAGGLGRLDWQMPGEATPRPGQATGAGSAAADPEPAQFARALVARSLDDRPDIRRRLTLSP